jgi:hypothetical protein
MANTGDWEREDDIPYEDPDEMMPEPTPAREPQPEPVPV